MPTYVYACSACETTFEAEQRITEPALDTCLCGSHGTVKRVIQPVGIAFKGSGFHINDYSAPAAKPETPASTTPAETPTTPTPAEAPASSSEPAPSPAAADKP